MIDIIIPIYNAHETICKTLMSIAYQTIKDKVIVYLIDDKSDKNYDKEIELFKDDINIKYYRLKENKGPGYARQYGMEKSSSDYIMFIDGDDLLETPFSLELLYNYANHGNDITYGRIIEEVENDQVFIYYSDNCLHGKLYRRKFIEKNNFTFNDSRYHEDNGFHRLLLLANPKTFKIDEDIYLYRNNNNSITRQDKDYDFKHLVYFVENRMRCLNIGEERKYNKSNLAELSFDTIVLLFCKYNEFFDREEKDKILLISKEPLKMYEKYQKKLDEKKICDLYFNVCNTLIPIISFDDFIKKIKEVNNES